MFKLLAFLMLFLPSVFTASPAIQPATEPVECACAGISNLQKTGQTSSSITYSWSSANMGPQYKVWYTRQEDGYTSGYFYTYTPSYCFSGLSAGHYTFHFQSLCDGESSSIIGIEDTIPA